MGQNSVAMTQQLDTAWAAGFFDGEGSISIRKLFYGPLRRTHYGLYLRCAQVERGPLDKFVRIFQTGSVRLSRAYDVNRAPYHDWCCAGTSAARVLDAMLPFLTVKHERAVLALEFRSQTRRTSGRRSLSTEEQDLRIVYYDRMRFLNLRQLPRAAAETKSRDSFTSDVAGSDSPVCIDDKDAEAGRNDQPRRLKLVGE